MRDDFVCLHPKMTLWMNVWAVNLQQICVFTDHFTYSLYCDAFLIEFATIIDEFVALLSSFRFCQDLFTHPSA